MKIQIALALALASAPFANAVLINVNFNGGGDSPAEATLSGPAGGLGTTWNSSAAVDTGALNNSAGVLTGVSIDTNYSDIKLGQETAGTLPIFRSYVDVFARPNSNTVTINGLDSEGVYDIWILSYRDITTVSTTERNVGVWETTNTTTSSATQSVDSQSGSPDGSAFQEGYNYVLFNNVVATVGGVISFTAKGNGEGSPQDGNSRRLHINGLQIQQVPEPSTTALLGLGGLALVFRRRK